VRNSGGKAVVEGCGDHGCEYMTGGVVVVLGRTGRNFAAGMSGGVAYVYDPEGYLQTRYNPGMVSIERVNDVDDSIDDELLRVMLERHVTLTESVRAKEILSDWSNNLKNFWKVAPHPSVEDATAKEQDIHSYEVKALEALRLESSQLVAAGD
jgi:glutamate synthase (ferredoxin)